MKKRIFTHYFNALSMSGLVLGLMLLTRVTAFGQQSLSAIDVAYTQNFSGMGSSTFNLTDNTSITGWYASKTSGNATPNVFTFTTGGSATGSLYSFGTSGSSERAMGSVGSSGTGDCRWGIRLLNNTGVTITTLDIAYAGEQWRNSAAAAQAMTVEYQIGTTVTGLSTGTYTSISALTFTSPITGGTAGAIDGNASANRVLLSTTLAVNINPGQEIMIRWTDTDHSGSDHGLAIDDVSITPHTTTFTNYYYKGTGDLAATANWGTNTDGTGSNPLDFTSTGQVFNIINTTSVETIAALWTVSGIGSKIVLGNSTSPITLSLAAGTQISGSMEVTAPSSGHHKVIYKNSNAISFGTIADTGLELVYDGATITTTTTRTYGDVSLINNANIDMTGASLVVQNLTVDATSTLSAANTSSNYIAIRTGGSVTINGTFKTGRTSGLVSTNIAIPVTPNTAYNALLFQDATEALTIGVTSTIVYYRGTTGNTGAQTIEARTYNNLIITNNGVSSNKTFVGVTTVTGNLTINLAANTVTATLGGNVTAGTLTLITGKVILGANTLTATTISGGSSDAYIVTDGAGVLASPTSNGVLKTFPIGASTTSFDPVEVTPTNGVNFSAKVSGTLPTAVSDNTKMAAREWNISATGAGSTVISLTNGGTAYTPTTASMGHYTGTAWEEFAATYSTNKWTATNVSGSFSPFGVGDRGAFNSITIPIELANFQVKSNQTSALLSWTTASEKSNDFFNIERSTNGKDFQTIGQVKGHGTTSLVHNYTFTDNTPPLGVGGLYYRLKQVDFNGSSTYSGVKSIVFGKIGLIIKNTLVHDALDIITNEDVATPLSIFNVSGQQIFNGKAQGAQRIDTHPLPAGLYIVRTATGEVGRFVKQ